MKTPRVLLLSLTLLAPPALADHPLGEKLGTIQFEVSGNAAARGHVVRGVKLMHHMMYPEADREFAAALAADPECVLGYWGRAMTIIHPLWPDVPSSADMKQGLDLVTAGLARRALTPRERDYLGTMEIFFRREAAREHPARLQALDVAWADVAQKHPTDLDAAAFSALFHLAPARFLPKDKSHRLQLEAAATIQAILAKIPDHPGAQHYKIHAHDFPLLADRALEICDSYGAIAPDVPHALHMPTHIFTRRGQWEKSIEFNKRSAEAARKLAEASGVSGHYAHAYDYLVYAYLQRGQYRLAEAAREELLGTRGPFSATQRTAMAFAFSAVPARCALERHDWSRAMQLQPRQPATFTWSDQFLYGDGIVLFARALGAVRSGQLDAARRELAEQERLGQRIAGAFPRSYWSSQAETQLLAVRGWLALQEGKKDEAVSLLRRAAELEATTDKEAVTPGEVLPAGELLGDLLIEIGRNREALAAYEAVLEVSPNRLNALYGAGRAAELAGDAAKATQHYAQLLTVASDADAGIARIEHAKKLVAGSAKGRTE